MTHKTMKDNSGHANRAHIERANPSAGPNWICDQFRRPDRQKAPLSCNFFTPPVMLTHWVLGRRDCSPAWSSSNQARSDADEPMHTFSPTVRAKQLNIHQPASKWRVPAP
jgi:hypothetical protein